MRSQMLWRPAPYAPPRQPFADQRSLGQTPVRGSEAFLASPLLALGTDIVGASAAAYLSYGFGSPSPTTGQTINKPMSIVWLAIATALAMKALHDFSRTNA